MSSRFERFLVPVRLSPYVLFWGTPRLLDRAGDEVWGRGAVEYARDVICLLPLPDDVVSSCAAVSTIVVLFENKLVPTGNPRPHDQLEDLLVIGLQIHLPVGVGGHVIPVEAVLEPSIADGGPRVIALLADIEITLWLLLFDEAIRARSLPGAPADVHLPLRAIAEVSLIREAYVMPVLLL